MALDLNMLRTMERLVEKRIRFALRLLLLLLSAAFLFPNEGWTKPIENCHIRIKTLTTLGEKNRLLFKTHLNSRKQCERLAQLHTPNFEPQKIARKDVGYKWVEIR